MNFRPHDRDEPELNLIPLIDVLIILLIFLVMTTTFAQQTGLEIRLPEAGTKSPLSPEKPLAILIDSEGHYRVSGQPVPDETSEALKTALKSAAGELKDPLILIEADRNSRHQALVMTLEALEQLGFQRISFATVSSPPH
jgi:biopolymer transport protein ExbD